MAKEMLNLQSFKGGLNNALDPRDIKPIELSKAKNVMFDVNGIIRCQGKGVSATGSIPNLPQELLAHGYAFFSFESAHGDPTGSSPASTLAGDYQYSEIISYHGLDADTLSAGGYWYVMSAGNYGRINIKESSENGWYWHTTTLHSSGNTEVYKAVYHISDEALRISNANIIAAYKHKNKWIGYIKQTNFFAASSGPSNDYHFNGWYGLDNDIKKPIKISHLAQGDGGTLGAAIQNDDTWNGTGFEMKVFATDGGSMDFSDEMTEGTPDELIYDLAISFIYDDIQESLLLEGKNNTIKESNGDAVVPADNNALSIQVAVKTGYNPRVTGGRIYYKIADSNDDYILLCDIDFEKGIRASLDNTYTTDTTWTGANTGVNDIYISNIVKLTSKNLDSYSSLTEWGARETRISIGCTGDNYPEDSSLDGTKISEGYKCSTIVNRRAFIANCKLYNSEASDTGVPDSPGDSKLERDRIYYSGMCTRNGVNFESAFDCFPRSNYIDVVKGDAEEYTALVGYADRLLAFKTNTLFIVNVAGDPVEWFLESQHEGMGILRPCQVTNTEDGIMWANTNGAYVYTGGEVRTTTAEDISFGADIKNLSRDKISKRDWINSEQTMSVGYVPERQQLIIIDNTESGNFAVGYIYDFNTNTWSESGANIILPEIGIAGPITNFVMDKNSNLAWGTHRETEETEDEMVVNGTFSQDIPDGVDGYMNDDNGSDGYGQTVDGYPATLIVGPEPGDYENDVRTWVNEDSDRGKLWQRSRKHPTAPLTNARVNYTLDDPLVAGNTYNISVDAGSTDEFLIAMSIYIQKPSGSVSLLSQHQIYGTPEHMSVNFLADQNGIHTIRLSGFTTVVPDGEDGAQWGWNNFSVRNIGVIADNIKFNSFTNTNTIIGAQDVDRFNMPAWTVASPNGIDIRTKDIDFGQTGLKKRIYAIYVTYRTENSSQTTPVSYALDGASAYNNDSASWTNLVGDMDNTGGAWTVGKFYPSSSLTCQSIRFKISNPSEGIVEINDIAVLHRVTNRKVA